MAMTMTQKILAAHAGLPEVSAGQLIQAKLNIVLGNDITTPVAVNEFKKAGFDGIYDKDKVVIVLTILCPTKISRLPSSPKPAGSSPASTASAISMTWARWASSMLCFGAGHRHRRRLHHRRRQPHLHLWCPGRLLHRCWQHGYGRRYGHGPGMV